MCIGCREDTALCSEVTGPSLAGVRVGRSVERFGLRLSKFSEMSISALGWGEVCLSLGV